MDRLVQSHLDRADEFRIGVHCLQQFVSCVGGAQVREDQRIHVFTFQAGERILGVTQFAVHGKVHLHFTIDGEFRIFLLHIVHCSVHFDRAAGGIGTEVGVRQHRDDRCMVEETDCLVSQFGDVNQSFRIRMTVDQRICQEVSTLLRIKNVHCSEMVESGLDADHFFGNFDGVAVSGIESGDKCVCISGFYHHHTEVVAFEHLVVGFFVCKAFAGTFFGKDA